MAGGMELQGCLQALSGTTLDAQGAAQALVAAVAAAAAAATPTTSGWTDWTPALTASVSNPVLGTGGEALGRYWEQGTVVGVEVWIRFGTVGVVAGVGTYSISLPVLAAAPLRTGGAMPIGAGSVTPIVTKYFVTVEQMTTTTVQLRLGGAGAVMVGEATPAAWGTGGEIVAFFGYKAAA